MHTHKIAACPTAFEERWQRTDPALFFLPDEEILDFKGQNALESQAPFKPWKVCFRDAAQQETVLQRLADVWEKDALEALLEQSPRLVVLDMSQGLVDVYQSEPLKAHFELMSAPGGLTDPSSPTIAGALEKRLQFSSPHELVLTVFETEEPPVFVFLNQLSCPSEQSYSRFRVHMKPRTQAQFIVVDKSNSPFSLSQYRIRAEAGAKIQSLWLVAPTQTARASYIERQITLEEQASFLEAQVFLPKGVCRVVSTLHHSGTRATSACGGVVIAQGGRFDYEPIQDHQATHGASSLKWNTLLSGRAQVSFQGLIEARQEAGFCTATQANKNILFSEHASVFAKPQLDVLPHDISCKHGSATGEMDPKQLAYLESRGFSPQVAKKLVSKGFAASGSPFSQEESLLHTLFERTIDHALA